MNNSHYDIVFTYEKKMFLGILDESLKTIVGFEEIKYSNNYDDLLPNQCSIVVISFENDKRTIIPLQSVNLQDDNGVPVVLGVLDLENVLESTNNVFRSIKNIIKFH